MVSENANLVSMRCIMEAQPWLLFVAISLSACAKPAPPEANGDVGIPEAGQPSRCRQGADFGRSDP
jgi:hypothetical protein